MKLHVKKGDSVTILTGKDKGKKGTILAAFPQTRKVLVDGINVVKRSMKARTAGSKGQVVEKSLPIDASNVRLADAPKKSVKKAKKAAK
jgi:large subunit ribosomal protein L24